MPLEALDRNASASGCQDGEDDGPVKLPLFILEEEDKHSEDVVPLQGNPFSLSPKSAADDGLSLKLSKWIKDKIQEADNNPNDQILRAVTSFEGHPLTE